MFVAKVAFKISSDDGKLKFRADYMRLTFRAANLANICLKTQKFNPLKHVKFYKTERKLIFRPIGASVACATMYGRYRCLAHHRLGYGGLV